MFNAIGTDLRKSNIYASFPLLVTGGEVSKLWVTKLVAEDKHGVMANMDGFCQSSVSSEPPSPV